GAHLPEHQRFRHGWYGADDAAGVIGLQLRVEPEDVFLCAVPEPAAALALRTTAPGCRTAQVTVAVAMLAAHAQGLARLAQGFQVVARRLQPEQVLELTGPFSTVRDPVREAARCAAAGTHGGTGW